MKANRPALAASTVLLALGGFAFAQDHSAHDMGSTMELPEACQTAEAASMPGMDNMQSAMEGMGEHQKAFMQGMMQTEGPMMQGMMAEDADVAFACAMIPHHQGAIDMAKVTRKHANDPDTKKMAQKIIDDQEKEIAEMQTTLNKNGK